MGDDFDFESYVPPPPPPFAPDDDLIGDAEREQRASREERLARERAEREARPRRWWQRMLDRQSA